MSLGALSLACLMAGCETTSSSSKKQPDPKKEVATLRLHLEANEISMGVGAIRVFRADPQKIFVEKTAFLDEGEITRATVVNDPTGGHMIQIETTSRGKMALQLATAPHPGRRVAVWSRWTEGRWLGAPVVQRGLEHGVFIFSPDCTRAEADRIVRGLNNIAIKLENQAKPKKPKTSGKDKKPVPTEAEEMFK